MTTLSRPRCSFAIVATMLAATLASARAGGQFQLALRQASLTGLILTAEPTPKPVRRAIVTLSSGIIAATDEQGRYTFPELAPGQYSVTASKGGYVDVVYGASTGLPARAVTLAQGERLELKPMKLVRGGVLAGRVFNYKNKPLAKVSVAAIPARVVNGVAVRRLGVIVERPTDDHGEYRLFGLKPGGYVLRVNGPSTGPQADQPLFQQGGLSAATTFYPGTTELDQIQVLTLRAGEDRVGLDFQPAVGSATRVSGIVVGPDGDPVRAVVNERTQLFQEASPGSSRQPVAVATLDGKFESRDGLAPGRHTLAVFPVSSTALPQIASGMFGMVSIVATGNDVTGLKIQLQPAPRVRGRLVFEGATGVPADMAQRWVSLADVGDPSPTAGTRVRIAADGTFLFNGVMPGSYRLLFGDAFLPWTSNWLPKSVILSDRDVLDLPFDVAIPEPAEIAVTMTNQPSEISGRLIDKAGTPAVEMVVLVVPDDRRYWLPGSRRIQVLRLASDGGFKTTGLPAGDYRLVTLSELDPDLRDDPTFLDQVVSTGLKVTLKNGEKWSQTLRVGG